LLLKILLNITTKEKMPRYTKKPITIDALQWTGKNKTEIVKFCTDCYLTYKTDPIPTLSIQTLEGVMTASVGDYIIKGIKGEFYPCKPDIFLETYNEVIN
jgi:hypothetical protein